MLSEILASLRARLLTTSTLAQETVRDGQTLTNGFFQSTVVDNTPAFILNNDLARLINFGEIETNGAPSAVSVEADDVQVFNFRTGSIEANGADATGIEVTDGSSADIRNFGSIAGELNGVEFSGPNSSGTLDNFRGGVISSDSRAVEIEGDGIAVRNFGDIIGTGDQRNGTIYTNATAENVSISNFSGGTIDAGEDNSGAGISFQVGDETGDVVSNTVFNGFGATIQGRGQDASNTPGAGDGIRLNNGADGAVSDTDIVNSGLISSESEQGTAGGIRIADGLSAEGRILNTSTGVIEGAANGLYIGEGEHDLDVLNFGTIQSDSRAVNIDGTGVNLINGGDILGTDDQRNGTVYADGTADDFTVSNLASGTIDAGEGNEGSGFGAEIGAAADGANTFELDNDGLIQGRGDAAAGTSLAGDGVRIGNPGNSGTTDATITNQGAILSEGANGTVAGVRVVDGVGFQGSLTNAGLIAGTQNGVYFGNGDHTDGVFINEETGIVSSDSRALNIDGTGLSVNNQGTIIGTGDQRNGTAYADGTADDFAVANSGLIDAGEGNQGSGFGAEIGGAEDGANTFSLNNSGTIQGRGNAAAGTPLAGDGVRIGNVGNTGTTDASIVNTGEILSEGANGTVAGVRVVNGINFQGTLTNAGLIAGAQNGVYFGTGDHTGGSFVNEGLVTSDSRALNIDGEGLEVLNAGTILGTGDQRNGTVYADGTADNYTFTNTGLVDAGIGNNGSAVSLQTGDVDGDVVSAAIFNEGVLQGRGDATEGNTVGDGLRLFSNQEDANFAGVVINEGLIAGSEDSDAAAGIRIDGGLNLLGAVLNEGVITGTVNAIDATDAGDVTFVNDDSGVVNGNVLLGDGEDIVVDLGQINGVIDGGAGDDVLIAGQGDNVIVGGLGNDFIEGGEGSDTADFSDLDVAVNVNLGANGNGVATRETGFTVSVEDVVVGASLQPTANIDDAAGFVSEALAGNLYYNIHTSDFPSGEIRGQFEVVSDEGDGHARVIELVAVLDASQEPGPTSQSDATGTATLTISVDEATGEVVYSSELTVVGLSEGDLQTPVPGVVSAIHLHNAPAGINGPIAQDTLVDAGATIDAAAPTGVSGLDVIDEVVETDILSSIENVIGSNDGDVITGSNADNTLAGEDGDDILDGGEGDDVLVGGVGNDIIEGGEGFDTADFSDLDVAVTVALDENGNGTATRDTGFTITTDPVTIPEGAGASVQATNVVDDETFLSEALAGNFYFNVHTSDVIGGEIRGQLDTIVSNSLVGDIRTIVIEGELDSAQEVGTGSLSEATGVGTLNISVNEATGEISYTSQLSVVGLNEADLQTPAPGVASAIHLHNAPAGQNGGIVRDTFVDAGAVIDANVPAGAGGVDVIDNQIEVDTLTSIERVVGSDDTDTVDLSAFDGVRIDLDVNTPQPGPASEEGVVQVDGETVLEVVNFENVRGSNGDDLILGNNEINVLEGLGGNDSIHSFGGADTIDGGDGIDTALFSAGAGVIVDLDEDGNAIAQINAPEGALIDTVLNFENINGSNNAGSPNGGNDILSGNSGANQLNGQAGDDILNGEGGDDILIGGEGADTFTFEGLFGNDTVNDFQSGVDRLDFTDFGPDFANELVVEDVDAGTLLTLGNNGSVLLAGVRDIDTDNDFVA